jgi:peptidoglycan/xylan/chitin deacetylase (PgdA/CDA1 family)
MYHRIGPVKKESIVPRQYVTAQAFSSHLAVLRRLGYKLLTPGEAMKGDHGALITFDDGYLDFFEAAVPLLERVGGSALVFLVTDQVGSTNRWDEAVGDVTEPLMDWNEVKLARKMGMAIGSHTMTHAKLSEVSAEVAVAELEGSKARIEKELGEACPWFCYPYGGMNESVVAAVKSAGYRAAFATSKGPLTPQSNPFAIPRINMRADTSSAILAYKIFRAVALGR